MGPLKRKADGSNVPPPHLVFQATGFKSSDDWNQAEVAEYHPGVVVSFQSKAWVDARTHIHGLTKMWKPINEQLGNDGGKGAVFEDNLSSHKTDEVLAFWGDELPNFSNPQFIPANMMEKCSGH